MENTPPGSDQCVMENQESEELKEIYAESVCSFTGSEEDLYDSYLRGTKNYDIFNGCLKPKASKKSKKKGKRPDSPQKESKVAEQIQQTDVSSWLENAAAEAPEVNESQSEAAPIESEHRHKPECSHGEKKLRMRPASDVISRILWDPELPAEHFSIGYLDRFAGLVEKPFQYFSWENLASVDYDVLAVPQHRIVYFKYRNVKVWDKNERFDLVFNSTETCKDTDIRSLISSVDDDHKQKLLQKALDTCSTDDSDDDDDDVDVCIDENPRVTLAPPKQNLPHMRPNYFVALRITDSSVIQKVNEAKEHMVTQDARLREFLMPDVALHITLVMLRLDDEPEVEAAAKALESCRESLKDYFMKLMAIELNGLDTFGSHVLYAKVEAPTEFYQMQKSLLDHLKENGVRLANDFEFVAHMTLLKLTKSRARRLGCPYVDPYTYLEYKQRKFGTVLCDNLHLCAIGEEKRWDGFYKCPAEVHFE